MASQLTTIICLFIPTMIVSLFTLIHLIHGCKEVRRAVRREKQQVMKSVQFIVEIVHSLLVILYFVALPFEILSVFAPSSGPGAYVLAVLDVLDEVYGVYYIHLWIGITFSSYCLQAIECYLLHIKQNYFALLICDAGYCTFWLLLLLCKQNRLSPVDYIVAWFIIIFHIIYSYVLNTKPVKVYMASTKWIMKHNHNNQHKLVSFKEAMSLHITRNTQR